MYTVLYDPTDPTCTYMVFFPDGSRTSWWNTLDEVLRTSLIRSDCSTVKSTLESYPDLIILTTSKTPISQLTHPELFI